MSSPLKSLLGRDADQYIDVKARWLRRDLSGKPERPVILDFGCGAGTLLRKVKELLPSARLLGCDPSRGMLEEARRRGAGPGDAPNLRLMESPLAPFPDAIADVVLTSCVLHHVPPSERGVVYSELLRLLRPGGRVYVFEHNPLNPVTLYVVRKTPIDRNAILLRAGECIKGLHHAGADRSRVRYLMFSPPRLRLYGVVDPLFSLLPLGASYVVRAQKRDPAAVT